MIDIINQLLWIMGTTPNLLTYLIRFIGHHIMVWNITKKEITDAGK